MAVVRGGEKAQAELDKLARGLSKATLRVGFLENATYEDGTPVGMIAAIHNFGAPMAGIPPRPFFSDMVRERSPDWPAQVASAIKQWKSSAAALELMGEVIKGQLTQKITTYVGVPLKPATVARKGFSKQLVDTAHMLNSVNHEVKT